MPHTPFLRTMLWVATVATGLGWLTPALGASTIVKGTVNLPSALKANRRFFGHWRVENTNVAIQPAAMRGGTIVLLAGPQYQAVPPKSASVEIAGLQATPATVVVSEGTVVEFKNSDKVSHELSTPGQPQVMAPERLSPGTVRKQRFASAGEYIVRCSEYPHIVVSVIVTNSPFFAVADDKGAFKISDVPEGHATLKVWSGGSWVKEAEIDIPARGLDLTIKVAGASGAAEPSEPAKDSTE
jgi:plastocyanin